MGEFVLYTIWFIIIAVMVNIVMEKVWLHIARLKPGEHEHDERGEAAPLLMIGRHRA